MIPINKFTPSNMYKAEEYITALSCIALSYCICVKYLSFNSLVCSFILLQGIVHPMITPSDFRNTYSMCMVCVEYQKKLRRCTGTGKYVGYCLLICQKKKKKKKLLLIFFIVLARFGFGPLV